MNEENKVVENVVTNQMPPKKKSNKGVIIVLVMIIILLLGGLGYFAYDKFIAHKDNKESKESGKKKDTPKEKSIKIDEDKDYVYDAEYDTGDAPESYGNETYTYYLKDIVVPYINIDSEGAKVANENIKTVFDELMAAYNDGANGGMGYVKYSEYSYYINDNILSIVFKTGTGATDVVFPYYHTYNFDLKTGERLTYEYAYGVAGFNSNSVYDKVKEQIEAHMKEHTYPAKDGEWSFDNMFLKSTSDYTTDVENGTIEFYFDDNNKLNIQATIWIAGGTPGHNREILQLN